MISGKEKLFQNGCRIRYCVAIILLQNILSFFGGEGFVELSLDSAIGNGFNLKNTKQRVYIPRRELCF